MGVKKILKKAEKIVYCDKTSKERIPIIYIRYFKGEVMYIGESSNYSSNRHSRIEEYSPFDRIRLLNAHKDTDIRRKWEAKLIVRLKPKMQRLDNYYKKASLDYKCSTDSSLIKTRNSRKIFLYLTKQYDAFIKIYEEILTYDLKRKKILIAENDTKKEEKEPYSFNRAISNTQQETNTALIQNIKKPNLEKLVEKTFRIIETCKNVNALPSDLLTSGLKRYTSYIKESVEGSYKICLNTLKPMGTDLPNITKLRSYLSSSLHPSMAQMYNDKVLKLDDLVGLKPYIKDINE